MDTKKTIIGLVGMLVAFQTEARLPIEELQREIQIRHIHTSQAGESTSHPGETWFAYSIPKNEARRIIWPKTPCSEIPPAYPADGFYGEELLPEEELYLVQYLFQVMEAADLWECYITGTGPNFSYFERPAFLDTTCTVENYESQFGLLKDFVAGLVKIKSVISFTPTWHGHWGTPIQVTNAPPELKQEEAGTSFTNGVDLVYSEPVSVVTLYPAANLPSGHFAGLPEGLGFLWDFWETDTQAEWEEFYAAFEDLGNPPSMQSNHVHAGSSVNLSKFEFIQPDFGDIQISGADAYVQVDSVGSGLVYPSGFTGSDMGHPVFYETLGSGEYSDPLKTPKADVPAFPDPVFGADRRWGWSLNITNSFFATTMDYKPVADTGGSCASCLDGPGEAAGGLDSMHYTIGLGSTINGDIAGILELGIKNASETEADLGSLMLHDFTGSMGVGYANGKLYNVMAPQCKVVFSPLSSAGFLAKFYMRDGTNSSYSATSERAIVVIRGFDNAEVIEDLVAGLGPTINISTDLSVYAYELDEGSVVKKTSFIPDTASDGDWEMTVEKAGGFVEEGFVKIVDDATNTIIRTVDDPLYGEVSRTVETYVDFDWGRELVASGTGAESNELWTSYSYYTTNSGYGQLELVEHPDGNWERYVYNSSSNLWKTVTPFGDQGPDAAESLCRVRTTTRSQDGLEQTVTEIETVLGTEISRTYTVRATNETTYVRCAAAGGGINDAGNLVTVTTYVQDPNDDSPFTGRRVSKIEHADGTLTLKTYPDAFSENTWHGEPNNQDTAVVDGTRTEIERNEFGYVVERKVYDIDSTILIDSEVAVDFDETGRPVEWQYLDGTTRKAIPGCCGIESETARDGSVRLYEYDSSGRVSDTTYENAEGVLITERTYHDAAGQLRKKGVLEDAEDVWLEFFEFDPAGRATSSTNLAGGATTYTESTNGSHLVKTTLNPDGGTIIEEYYLDGRLYKRTGTAAAHVRMEHGVEGGELYEKTIQLGDSGQVTLWSKTYSDFLGRPYKTLHSDSSYEQSWYNDLGQVEKTVDRDGVVTLFAYNDKGEREVVALDFDLDDAIDYRGYDRVVKTVSDVVAAHSTNVRRTTTQIWDIDNKDTPRTVAVHEVSVNGLQVWDTQEGQETHTLTAYTPAEAKRTDAVTNPDGTKLITTTINGQLSYQEWKDSLGATTRTLDHVYDDLGRIYQQVDSQQGTVQYGYTDSGLLSRRIRISRTDPADILIESYGYDDAMRVTSTTNADSSVIFTEFDPNGQVKKQHGAGIYPVEYGFDVQGRKTTMKTWQDYSGNSGIATTTWSYNPTNGYLARKEYQGGNGTDYTYTPGGKIKTRTWERGGTTTYSYDVLGNLESVDYSDSTPDISYTHDRTGRIKTASNANAAYTYTYTDGLLTSENVVGPVPSPGATITRTYDTLNRPTGYSLGGTASPQSVTYAYNAQGNLSSITSSVTSVVDFPFDPTTGLPTGHAVNAGGSGTLTVSRSHDGFNRLSSVDNSVEIDPGGMTPPTSFGVSRYTYTHNDLGQRTSMQMDFGEQGLDSKWNYEYDSLGQMENAWKTAGGKVVPGRQYGYEFDEIGNRLKTTRGNNTSDLPLNPTPVVTSTYTPNLLNQYSQRTIPAYAEISGTANPDAILSFLNENTAARIRAGRNGEWFHAYMPLSGNSSSGVTNNIRMTGVLPGQGTGGADLINTNQTFSLSAMKTPETFTYDDDGNLTSDGRFSYAWNCENRLVAVSNETTLVASYKYDHQGRRVSKTVSDVTTVFVWDGNHIVYELIGSNPNVYTWGNNGHLVTASLNGTNVFYAHDGNKNVTDLIDAGGNVVAHYEYDPFGNEVVKTGVLAGANPFRFSNEYVDAETGHVAYMLRYYEPPSGRFLNHDPIGDMGGLNEFGFVHNDPVSRVDYIGLADLPNIPTWIMSKEKIYKIASQKVRGEFAQFLLRHYLWGQGRTVSLHKNSVLRYVKPLVSLRQSEAFMRDVKTRKGYLFARNYEITAFDHKNPSGGLGYYQVKVNVNVCVNNGHWKAEGLAAIEDRWDFDWKLANLIKEWQRKFDNNQVFINGELNLGGRETRTALGSAIPGEPFNIESDELNITQGDRDRVMYFK